MRSRSYLKALFFMASAVLTGGFAEAQVTISPDSKASFKFGSSFLSIYASVRNTGDVPPQQWQFRYDPLFAPVVDKDGSLTVNVESLADNTQISFTILLDNLEARDNAFTSIQEVYPQQATLLSRNNMRSLEVSSTSITISDLQVFFPEYTLRRSSMTSFDGQSRFTISLLRKGEEDRSVDEIRRLLSELYVDLDVTFEAKTGRRNSITIAMSKAKSTQLYEELNGLGSNIVYVHRDQFRRMFETATTSLVATEILEGAPSENDRRIFEQIVDRFTTPISSEDFDDLKWSKTYSADDLSPSKLTRILNDIFVKDQGKNTWNKKIDGGTSGKFSFLDMFKAESDGDLELSDEGLKEYLRERDIKVEIEADGIIVPKALDLLQIDIGEFFADRSVTRAVVYLEGDQRSQSHSLYVKEAIASGRTGRILDYALKRSEACGVEKYGTKEVVNSCQHEANGIEVLDRRSVVVTQCRTSSMDFGNSWSAIVPSRLIGECDAKLTEFGFFDQTSLNPYFWKLEGTVVENVRQGSNPMADMHVPNHPNPRCTAILNANNEVTRFPSGGIDYDCRHSLVRTQPKFGQNDACGVTVALDQEKPIYHECRHYSHGFDK